MKKQEYILQIIQELLDSPKCNKFSKPDIEQAIRIVRQALDQRTIDNWFNLLWKLGYLTQPMLGVYVLDIVKLQELEVKLPVQVDPNQRRLFNV